MHATHIPVKRERELIFIQFAQEIWFGLPHEFVQQATTTTTTTPPIRCLGDDLSTTTTPASIVIIILITRSTMRIRRRAISYAYASAEFIYENDMFQLGIERMLSQNIGSSFSS